MAAKRKKSKTFYRRDEERRFTVRGIRRDPPDLRKLSKALIGLAMAEAERQAETDHARHDTKPAAAAGDDRTSGGEGDG